jgi:hypothetical protein
MEFFDITPKTAHAWRFGDFPVIKSQIRKEDSPMSNRIKNNPWASDPGFEPYDQDTHARDLEQTDVFNVMTNDAPPGGLRQKLAELVATNADAQQAVLESGGSLPTVAKNFHVSSGETGVIVCDSKGVWRATITLNGEPLSFTSESRDEAMMACERYLEKNRGPRDLTPEEELLVKRVALAGESANAAQLYCELRLSNMKHRSEQEILTDPSLVGVLNDGARFVWSCTRPDYIPSAEFDELLDRVSATRVLNINIVDILYDRFTDHQAAAARAPRRAVQAAAPESEPVVTQDDLERLSTTEIAKLRQAALLERGRRVRKFDQEVLGR